jgi:hypothetical protein
MGFSHGEPGSMNRVRTPASRQSSRSAQAIISGPMSIRRCSGASGGDQVEEHRLDLVGGAGTPRPASPGPRGGASTAWSDLSRRPSVVSSNWKSSPTPGWAARPATAPRGLRLGAGRRSPSSHHNRCTRS